MPTGSRPQQLTARELAIVGRYSAQHGALIALEAPIPDVNGAIGNPLHRVSVLEQLERRGAISSQEAAAGDEFARLFRIASLDTLRAADMSRVPIATGMTSGDISPQQERCRQRVTAAMVALGGAGSAAASVVWGVVGLEMSVRQWAINTQRRHEVAGGILIGALSVLAAHFGGRLPR